jgi:alkylated DNA repair dioxygenase AlkB
MPDLFRDPAAVELLALPGADIRLFDAFLGAVEADLAFKRLMDETPWEQRKVFVWGQWRVQPRLIAWYGEPHARYSYSGDTLEPLAWTATLAGLRERVESAAGTRFNSVLLNLYRDQNDRMGWHNDDEPELGERPVIASLSLGAPRRFLLKSRDTRRRDRRAVMLAHGSLLIMAGDTQENWVHALNTESTACGPRINLTFRLIRRPLPLSPG